VITHLVDTDVVIGALRGRPGLRGRFVGAGSGVVVSTVTIAELEYGVQRSARVEHNSEALAEFVGLVTVVPFDRRDAYESGLVRAELAEAGEPIGPYDVQLAGQARARGLVLASGNVREFRRVRGLEVENWLG
jgi:tRNA(fMet)-specific endonuclease VapC